MEKRCGDECKPIRFGCPVEMSEGYGLQPVHQRPSKSWALALEVFVFAFAFVFSLVAFLQLLLRLPFVRVLRIHLGLLYALDMSCCELGA
jgi:hypothetical protein